MRRQELNLMMLHLVMLEKQSKDICNTINYLLYNNPDEIPQDEDQVLKYKLNKFKELCEKTIETINMEDISTFEDERKRKQIVQEILKEEEDNGNS